MCAHLLELLLPRHAPRTLARISIPAAAMVGSSATRERAPQLRPLLRSSLSLPTFLRRPNPNPTLPHHPLSTSPLELPTNSSSCPDLRHHQTLALRTSKKSLHRTSETAPIYLYTKTFRIHFKTKYIATRIVLSLSPGTKTKTKTQAELHQNSLFNADPTGFHTGKTGDRNVALSSTSCSPWLALVLGRRPPSRLWRQA